MAKTINIQDMLFRIILVSCELSEVLLFCFSDVQMPIHR